jgi:DnaJ-domain-containing protein 1
MTLAETILVRGCVSIASLGAAAALCAHVAHRLGAARWAALAQLFLGGEEEGSRSARRRPLEDLRFVTLAATLAAVVPIVLATAPLLRLIDGAGRFFVALLGIPLCVFFVAAAADLARLAHECVRARGERRAAGRSPKEAAGGGAETGTPAVPFEGTRAEALASEVPDDEDAFEEPLACEEAAAPEAGPLASDVPDEDEEELGAGEAGAEAPAEALADTDPAVDATAADRGELAGLLASARERIAVTRSRNDHPPVQETLDALEETLAEYESLLGDGSVDLDRLKTKIRELEMLAEEMESDVGEPFRVLGVRPHATVDQVRKVYRALARIYHDDAREYRPGVDPDRFKEISTAYARILDSLGPAPSRC